MLFPQMITQPQIKMMDQDNAQAKRDIADPLQAILENLTLVEDSMKKLKQRKL